MESQNKIIVMPPSKNKYEEKLKNISQKGLQKSKNPKNFKEVRLFQKKKKDHNNNRIR